MLIRALKLDKNNGTKINQGTFRIDRIVRLIAIQYLNRSTALIVINAGPKSWIVLHRERRCIHHGGVKQSINQESSAGLLIHSPSAPPRWNPALLRRGLGPVLWLLGVFHLRPGAHGSGGRSVLPVRLGELRQIRPVCRLQLGVVYGHSGGMFIQPSLLAVTVTSTNRTISRRFFFQSDLQ